MPVGTKSKNIRTVEVVSNIPEQMKKIELFAKEFDEYYYIYHDCDKDDDGTTKKRHIHCIVFDKNGTTLNAWISRWSHIVPANMVEMKLYKPSAIKYLTHETAQAIADGKYLYDRRSVVTNRPEKYNSYFSNTEITVAEKLEDFMALKNKEITFSEYVEKYRAEINELNIYQQNRLFGDLMKYGL